MANDMDGNMKRMDGLKQRRVAAAIRKYGIEYTFRKILGMPEGLAKTIDAAADRVITMSKRQETSHENQGERRAETYFVSEKRLDQLIAAGYVTKRVGTKTGTCTAGYSILLGCRFNLELGDMITRMAKDGFR